MSHNQSRAERTESSSAQYRKTFRSGYTQQRSFPSSGVKGGGGGASAPPPSLSNQSRSFKKYNNAQNVQARTGGPSVNSDSSGNQTTIQNGATTHLQQQPSPGISEVPVTSAFLKSTDVSAPRTTTAVPKAPSSNVPATGSEMPAPITPAKVPGEATRPFPFQFGSISPGLMNGMQIPARTSSAPPNLDEQKRAQARHEASSAAPAFPTPSIPKQQLPKKDGETAEHSNAGEVHSVSKSKRDGQVLAGPPVTQSQKPSVHRMAGMPMQMPYHQTQVPLQFGGPPPQIQSQGITATSVPMPMQMPMSLPLGNPQMQQPLFVSGLQPHLMQHQGLIHQGQGLNFSSQMGPQMSPQLGNIGINMGQQFPPQQSGKVSGPRKVKITHPDTHEELRFDGSSGPRSHPNMPPQSQPIPSAQHAPINYHSKSPILSSHFLPAAGAVPGNNTQINPSSQAPRLYNQVTIKSASGSRGEKETVSSSSSPAVGKAESPKGSRPSGQDSVYSQKGFETSLQSSLQQSKPGFGPVSVESKPSAGVLASESVDSLSSLPAAHVEDSASGQRHEQVGKSDIVDDQPRKAVDRECSIAQGQVGKGSAASSSLSSHNMETKSAASEVTREVAEIGVEPPTTSTKGAPDFYGSKSDHGLEDGTCEPSKSFGVRIEETKHSESQTLPEVPGNLTADCTVPGSESLTCPKSISESSKGIGQIECQSLAEVTGISSEGSSLETLERKLEESAGGCIEDEKGINNVDVPTLISEVKDAATGLSMIDTSAPVDKTSTSSDPADIQDQINFKDASRAKSTMSNQDSTSVSVPSPSEDNFRQEEEAGESKSSKLISQSSAVNEKSLQGHVTKTAAPKVKKKRRELFKKADAAGATSDLFTAYKGPEEKKENATSDESTGINFSDNIKQISSNAAQEDFIPTERDGQSKAEPDDWEDADFSTPKLEPSQNVKEVDGGFKNDDGGDGLATKKYSRDFLLKFSEKFTDLPEGFKITLDIEEALMVSDANVSRESDSSFGRVIDRPMSGSRPDRRGSGMGDEEKWSKQPGPFVSGRDMLLDIGPGAYVMGFRPGQGGNYGVLRNPRAQVPLQYPGAILPGLMQPLGPQGGIQRNNSDSERWQRGTAFQKGLMPSPQTPQTPLQMMHRTERKYQVGKVTGEEEGKQRQLKAILNKLTPQNFEKLFEQVKQVNIDNDVTLTGVISQIFDKALMEPTFCEMYANFCYRLAAELPDLSVDNEKITFKRLLLNKCQEEFERGVREQEEANKADEEGEVKQSVEEREEKRLQARRRMLGNIRLIGELYKKKMLTERIMHECIKKLLGGSDQIPDEEDVEALCKLMSTIGEMIDHSRAKEHMDAYFDMMAKLSTNTTLSSRVRFMLLDAIDLRKNKWQQRRKVEGPKKIEEVHRDAAQERQAQASRLARAPSIGGSARRGQPMDFAPRGPSVLSSPSSQIAGLRAPQLRGFGAQDGRFGDRLPFENRALSVPLPQRTDDSITLGPQGGLGRGMSFRGQPSTPSIPLVDVQSPGDSRRVASGLNGYNSIPERAAHGSREDSMPRYLPERFASPSTTDQSSMQERSVNYGNKDARNTDRSLDRTLPTSPPVRGVVPTSSHTVSSEKAWPEERLRDMSMSTIKEFYSAKDENEVVLCIKDLNAPSFYPSMISLWVTDSFERKDMERDLLAKLLVNLAKSRDHVISQDQLIKGFESVLETLEDAVNDAPRAAEFLGRMFARVISENVVSLDKIGELIYEGGEEQGRLVEIGLAAEVLGTILETIKSEKGENTLADIRTSSNLPLESFRPCGSNKSWRLDKFI